MTGFGKLMNYRPIPIHKMTLQRIVKFWSGVDRTGYCWTFSPVKPSGYAYFWISDGYYAAHRISYMLFYGSLSTGLTIDHECNNRACVRPDHLKPKTNRDNGLRGNSAAAKNSRRTHCKYGHPYDRVDSFRSSRACSKCRTIRQRNYRRNKRKVVA